jgi:cytoskeletal protein RodZ
VFEIGNSLREARLRQGLDLPRVEADTKIRGKYLRALEDERFEVLPGDTYVKGFLRTYADRLGLEGQLYVDEYNSRFSAVEEAPAPRSAAPRRRSRPVESNLVIVALAGIVAVTVLVLVAFAGIGEGPERENTPLLDVTSEPTTTEAGGASTEAEDPAPAGPAAKARLVLTAADGPSWLQVRAGSVNGRLLWEGTLEPGQSQRFVKNRRLWLELGAPANLSAKLNGERVRFPRRPAVVLVTADGVRTISTSG